MIKKDYPTLQAEKEKADWDKLTDQQKWDKYQELCREYDILYRDE